ncbi:MAG: hypothetical protein AAFV77_04195 [Planctomycetota bacterium]
MSRDPAERTRKLHLRIDAKVKEIFEDLAGERASRLKYSSYEREELVREPFRKALKKDFGKKASWEIAFHLLDWRDDAAFIVAITLFPERFTRAEIRARTMSMLVHAPHHVMAAAHWAECDLRDVFGLDLKLYGQDEFPDSD